MRDASNSVHCPLHYRRALPWARFVLVLATAVTLGPRASRPEAVELRTIAAAQVAEVHGGKDEGPKLADIHGWGSWLGLVVGLHGPWGSWLGFMAGPVAPEPLSDAQGGTTVEETGVVHPFLKWTTAMAYVLCISVVPYCGTAWTRVTRDQVVESAMVTMVNVGALVLFTQGVLFASIHWEGSKHLTLIEAMYLMAQMLTTVGYGDIYPAHPYGRLVVGLYILFCVIIMQQLLLQIAKGFAARMTSFQERLDQNNPNNPALSPVRWLGVNAPTLPWARFQVTSLAAMAVVSLGTGFFVFHPEEKFGVIDAFYMQLMTMSTEGFGIKIPKTEIGFLFQTVFMPVGVFCFAMVIDAAAELFAAAKLAQNYNISLGMARVKNLAASEACNQETCDTEINKYQFLRFVLVNREVLTQADLDDIATTFAQLGPSNAGLVPVSKIIETIECAGELAAPTKS